MKAMKKFFIITGAITAAILILLTGLYLHYKPFLSKPSVRFLMHMSELTTPGNFTTEEKTINIDDGTLTVMLYKHKSIRSDKYYILFHGLTPDEYNHPTMKLLAGAICDATGMNVLRPYIVHKTHQTYPAVQQIIQRIITAYTTLYNHYPGQFRAVGICISATALLIALEDVPREIYPDKLLLIGPMFDGKSLIEFYNKNGVHVDFIVRLSNSMNNMEFTEKERKLIAQAFKSTKPGPTDKNQMKKILGSGLYNNILMMKVENKEIENMNVEDILGKNKSLPSCEYFILHTSNDTIIPQAQGKKLYNFMKKNKFHTNFIGTELYDHSKKAIKVSGFIKELKYLVQFYDGLFKGDVIDNH